MSLHKYRIEAGTGSNVIVGQVDVQDGRIVATPHIWSRFKGQALHRLEWWLAAVYRTCSVVRLPNLEDPEGERRFWEEGVTALKASNSVCTVSEESPQGGGAE